MAEECSDHGMTILHYLFGFSSGEVSDLGASQDKTETSAVFSVGLLSKLCDPTSDVNKQRCERGEGGREGRKGRERGRGEGGGRGERGREGEGREGEGREGGREGRGGGERRE